MATAWASATADGQDEWLELEYDAEIEPATVLVYESYNPGALTRVVGLTRSGMEAELWSGKDPLDRSAGIGVSEIEVERTMKTNRIRLYLNSKDVPGWNEIDAVGLRDKAGETHWAVRVTASSCYASPRVSGVIADLADPFAPVAEALLPRIVVVEEEEEALVEMETPPRDPRDERIDKLEAEVRALREAVKALQTAIEQSRR
ncbi:MAG: hypothetical protein RIC55_11530 [Pirellulaceae bacterium]